jgi:hypothetical protein
MPYGQFVQEDTLIGVRTAAAVRPFTQEAGVIDQVAMAAPAADQNAAASGAFFGNPLGAPLTSLADTYDAGALGAGSVYYHSSGWHGGGHPRFARRNVNEHQTATTAPARVTTLDLTSEIRGAGGF